MNWQLRTGLFLCCIASSFHHASAQFADEVIFYDEGTTPASAAFTDPSAAIGSPESITGEDFGFAGPVTPFNPPFQDNEIVSIGEGGQLTLRLSNFVLPQASTPEIGVFVNVGLIDTAFPNGQASDPISTFNDLEDSALVEVSADGDSWVSLGETLFDTPTNAFNDAAATEPADFQQPFVEPLSSFAGLPFDDATNPDILGLLVGSGGGTWLDISDTGLSQVGYIRFSVADDNNVDTSLNFELDAVSIARIAVGETTIPEPNTLAIAAVCLLSTMIGRRANR